MKCLILLAIIFKWILKITSLPKLIYLYLGFIRFSLVLMILFLSWYTFQLYAELFNRLTVKKSNSVENEKADTGLNFLVLYILAYKPISHIRLSRI